MASLIKEYISICEKYKKLVDQYKILLKEKNKLQYMLNNSETANEAKSHVIEVLKQKIVNLKQDLKEIEDLSNKEIDVVQIENGNQEIVSLSEEFTSVTIMDNIDESTDEEINVEDLNKDALFETTDDTVKPNDENDLDKSNEEVTESSVKKTRRSRKNKNKNNTEE